jgi:stage V sporulation protein R
MGLKFVVIWKSMGYDRVEAFIDRVLSIENLISINELFETESLKRRRRELVEQARSEGGTDYINDDRSESLKSFMRSKKRNAKKKVKAKVEEAKELVLPKKVPPKPERDVMQFLINFAPLEEWQADVLGILREEAYYFLPQRLTKIMNEGWASYWHSTIMTQRALDSSEIIDFADKHAGVMAMSKQQMNPYKVGIELMRDIEYRWDTGRFGKEYNECTNMNEKHNWDLKLGKGREKIFEVRRTHNDVSFIDEFLTPEFCERQQLFTYKYNPRTGRYEIDKRDFEAIKAKLLNQLTNFGSPVIEVEDGNFKNRGELLLSHVHYGVDLDMNYCADTLRNVYAIWSRPVNIKTKYDDKEVIFHFDGKEMKPIH